MSDVIITKIFEIAPQLALLILFIIAIWLLFKEYRSLRKEIDTIVNIAVDSKLGSLIGKIQIESAQATELLEKINKIYSSAQSMFNAFENMATEKVEQVNKTLSDVEKKLEILGQALPTTTNFSAQDYGVLAATAESLGEAISLIEKAKNDPDATSGDLEKLGDTARKLRKWRIARDLYTSAITIDPENNSAKIELLCLIAETDAQERNNALRSAEDLVVTTREKTVLSRLSNAFIELDRYSQMEGVCRKVLEQENSQISPIYIEAQRNLAVALKAQGKLADAEEVLVSILQVAPQDENSLSAYISLLRQKGLHEKALPIAEKLLDIDPLDSNYYLYYARELVECGKNDMAIQWFEVGEQLIPPTNIRLKAVFSKEKLSAIHRKENSSKGSA
ncbi:MAG: tetratricopeptide repeat protein [Anaerolineaceae bacterium]